MIKCNAGTILCIMVLMLLGSFLHLPPFTEQRLRVSLSGTSKEENQSYHDSNSNDLTRDSNTNDLRMKLAAVEKVVVYSTSNNPFYSFYAPITAWVWKHRIGYTPVVLVTEDLHSYVRQKIEEAGGIVITVGNGMENIPSISQTSRVLAGALPFPDHTTIITGDCDMIPLRKSYYHTYNGAYKFHALNAIELSQGGEYPICYMIAQARVWRQIIGYKYGDTIDSMLKSLMDGYGMDAFKAWNFDQTLIYRLVQQAAQGDEYFVEVLGHGPRQDRSMWRPFRDGEDIDSHSLRPGFTSTNWPRVSSDLLKYIMPDDALAWATDYREEFVKLVRGGDAELGALKDGMGRTNRRRHVRGDS